MNMLPSPTPLELTRAGFQPEILLPLEWWDNRCPTVRAMLPCVSDLTPECESRWDEDKMSWEVGPAPEKRRECRGLDKEQCYPESHLWFQRPSFNTNGTKRHFILYKLNVSGDVFYCRKII